MEPISAPETPSKQLTGDWSYSFRRTKAGIQRRIEVMENLSRTSTVPIDSAPQYLKDGSSRRNATIQPHHQLPLQINPTVSIHQCRMCKTAALVVSFLVFFSFVHSRGFQTVNTTDYPMTSLKSVLLKCFPFFLVVLPSNNKNNVDPFPRLRSRLRGTTFQMGRT